MPSNDPEYQKRYIRQHYQDNKDYYKAKSVARKASLSKEKRLWESVRSRANKAGIPFGIDISDITVPNVCPILKKPFEKSGQYGASVDKFIPALGYVKGNVAVISRRVNLLKNNATLEEIEALYLWMKERESIRAASE